MAEQNTPQEILNAVFDSTNRALKTNTTVAADIEIGQVELKDSDSTAQANIKAANTARTTATVVLANQHIDAAGTVGGVTLNTLVSGEDQTNDVIKNEQQFSYSAVAVADVQVKGAAGFLHTVTISCNDAAPTAGSLIIYDSLTETGTVVFNHTFTTTPFMPFTVLLNYKMLTGIYLGFTTVGDVNVSCGYR